MKACFHLVLSDSSAGPSPPVTRDQLTMLEAGDNVVTNPDAVDTFGLPLVPLDEQLRRRFGARHIGPNANVLDDRCMLCLAQIGRDSKDPEGGTIDRAPDGSPTGVLKDEAQGPVAAVIPMFNLPEAGVLLIMGIDHFLDMGRTATNVLGNGIATGVGILIAMQSISDEEAMIGLVPAGIGLAYLIYYFVEGRKIEARVLEHELAGPKQPFQQAQGYPGRSMLSTAKR